MPADLMRQRLPERLTGVVDLDPLKVIRVKTQLHPAAAQRLVNLVAVASSDTVAVLVTCRSTAHKNASWSSCLVGLRAVKPV
jgi:hypothetical protein